MGSSVTVISPGDLQSHSLIDINTAIPVYTQWWLGPVTSLYPELQQVFVWRVPTCRKPVWIVWFTCTHMVFFRFSSSVSLFVTLADDIFWERAWWEPDHFWGVHLGGVFVPYQTPNPSVSGVSGHLPGHPGGEPAHYPPYKAKPLTSYPHVFLPAQLVLLGNLLHKQCGPSAAGSPPGGAKDPLHCRLRCPDVHLHHHGPHGMLPSSSHGVWSLHSYMQPPALQNHHEWPGVRTACGCFMDHWHLGGSSSNHVDLQPSLLWLQPHPPLLLRHPTSDKEGMHRHIQKPNCGLGSVRAVYHEPFPADNPVLHLHYLHHTQTAVGRGKA